MSVLFWIIWYCKCVCSAVCVFTKCASGSLRMWQVGVWNCGARADSGPAGRWCIGKLWDVWTVRPTLTTVSLCSPPLFLSASSMVRTYALRAPSSCSYNKYGNQKANVPCNFTISHFLFYPDCSGWLHFYSITVQWCCAIYYSPVEFGKIN